MDSVRLALRAAALEDYGPAEMLDRADRLLQLERGGMVTALVGLLDTVTLEFTYASAGQPPPVLCGLAREVAMLELGGPPLGLGLSCERAEHTIQLRPGSLLLLYTDGLIEAERDPLAGQAALVAAVGAEAKAPSENPVAAIRRRLLRGRAGDDIAMLGLRIQEAPSESINIAVVAEPANVRHVRKALQRFAIGFGVSETRLFDLQVAVGEALTNVVEHAYGARPGTLWLHAFKEGDALCLEVKDRGTWRPERDEERGRGLMIMRKLMDDVCVHRARNGTIVRLRMSLSEPARAS